MVGYGRLLASLLLLKSNRTLSTTHSAYGQRWWTARSRATDDDDVMRAQSTLKVFAIVERKEEIGIVAVSVETTFKVFDDANEFTSRRSLSSLHTARKLSLFIGGCLGCWSI